MRIADNPSIENRLQEIQQKIDTNVTGGRGNEFEMKVDRIERRLEKQDRKERRKNIIIRGLDTSGKEA